MCSSDLRPAPSGGQPRQPGLPAGWRRPVTALVGRERDVETVRDALTHAALVTVVAFAVMAAGTVSAIFALRSGSFGLFFGSFLLLFLATGAGNGSVYRMIPAVFRHGAGDDVDRARRAKVAAGCIGIAGAVGAVGGFLIPRGFAVSTTQTGGIEAALWVIVAMYAVMAATTWVVYGRRGSAFGDALI